MFSGSRTALALALIGAATLTAADLRVCADPENLPYSNRQQQGFENKLADLVGRELGRPIHYEWIPQRKPFFKALQQGACDLVMGVPSQFPLALTTQPYYRSSYVFASRRDRNLDVQSFDDPRLKTVRIGLQIVQEGDGDVPPAQALARRGILRNISWYPLNENYLTTNQRTSLLQAVSRGQIDVAVVWGPLAGNFAKHSKVPLRLTKVSPQSEGRIPFAFDMSMGVRPGDTKLAGTLNSIIRRRQVEIRRLLESYGVPLVNPHAAGPLTAKR